MRSEPCRLLPLRVEIPTITYLLFVLYNSRHNEKINHWLHEYSSTVDSWMLKDFVTGHKICTRRGCKNSSFKHLVINLRNGMVFHLPMHACSSRSTKTLNISFTRPPSRSMHHQTRILSSCSYFILLTLSALRRPKARAMASTVSLSILFFDDYQKLRKLGLSLCPSFSTLAAETASFLFSIMCKRLEVLHAWWTVTSSSPPN